MALGALGGGHIDIETCYLSKSQLILRQELILEGLAASNLQTSMSWQVQMISGMEQIHEGENAGELLGGEYTKRRVELYGRAVDTAFPYMDLSTKIQESAGATKEAMIEEGERIENRLKLNPSMTADEFLASDI